MYFVHSYYLKAEEDVVTATAQYGVEIHAAVQKNNLMACQFHPEKSGALGLKLLENFAAMTQGKGACNVTPNALSRALTLKTAGLLRAQIS